MARRALILVDLQYDFCEGGSLPVAGGLALATRLAAALRDPTGLLARYDLLVTTQDWHIDPGGHFAAEGAEPDFDASWPVHCVAGSAGARIIGQLDEQIERIDAIPVIRVFKGHHSAAYSGFEGVTDDGESLVDLLRARGITDVDVVGIATDYCVKQTAIDAARAGLGTTVLADYSAGIDAAAVTALHSGGFATAGITVA